MATPEKLRSLFKERLKSGVPTIPSEFDPIDVESRLNNDKYLMRIIKHQKRNVEKSFNMLWDIMTWRTKVGANQITESNIKLDLVKEGMIFPRGRDHKGCLLIIVKAKMHVKGQKNFEDLKRVIIYWFERIEREENGRPVTLFFDLDGCGLSNLDMELVKYLITLLSSYYPYFLNHIVLYQMPWILSAAVKMIKSVLPADAIEMIKFPNKNTLKEIVSPEQALTCWGGKDDYVFKFVPEVRKNADANKKVTFAEPNNDSHLPSEMLRLQPSKEIVFNIEKNEFCGQFDIKNMNGSAVSFKIRTTAPEKFRVRPSSGVLAVGSIETIAIVVVPGFDVSSVLKERFSVVSIEIPKTDLSQKELSELWKSSLNSKIYEHKLKCSFPANETTTVTVNETKTVKEDNTEQSSTLLKELQSSCLTMQKQIEAIKVYQTVSLFLSALGLCISLFMYKHINEILYIVNRIR